MTTDETQIREQLAAWVAAVRAGDLDAVAADRTRDVVMFDVPAPHDGVRGIDAYRDTWPPFFRWRDSGAAFVLESAEVTAGRTSRGCSPCCAAGPPTSSRPTPIVDCDRPSGCVARTVAGSSHTSTTRSRTRHEGRRLLPWAASPPPPPGTGGAP